MQTRLFKDGKVIPLDLDDIKRLKVAVPKIARAAEEQQRVNQILNDYKNVVDKYPCYADAQDENDYDANILAFQGKDYHFKHGDFNSTLYMSEDGDEIWTTLDYIGNCSFGTTWVTLPGKVWDKGFRDCDYDQGKWGLIDEHGEYLIRPQYDFACKIWKNIHAVGIVLEAHKKVRWGLVDDSNNILLPFVFEWFGTQLYIQQDCIVAYYYDEQTDYYTEGIYNIRNLEWVLILAKESRQTIVSNPDKKDCFYIYEENGNDCVNYNALTGEILPGD